MKIFDIIGECILVEWMWSVSWGITQIPLAFIFLTLFLWWFTPLRFVRALLSALLASLLSYGIFSFCIMLSLSFLAYSVAYTPSLESYEYALSGVQWESFIGFGLAGILSFLQLMFLFRIHRYAQISAMRLIIIILASNYLAAALTRALLITF